jgi:hypothetical protein
MECLRVYDIKLMHKKAPTTISKENLKALLGGRWPKGKGTWWEGFGFEEVDCYILVGDELVPMDGGSEAPGPNFKIVPVEDDWIKEKKR